MPPRTTAAAESTGAPARRSRAAGARKAPRTAAKAAAAADNPMQTFAEHTGARDFPVVADNDEKLNTRSFQLPIGVVERLRATADGVQHLGYGTELEGKAPDSISGLVTESFNAICTYYEDLLNNGEPFRRVRKLSPGARPSGAARGAAKRSETAAAKRAAKSESE